MRARRCFLLNVWQVPVSLDKRCRQWIVFAAGMKPIRWSDHAIKKLARREVDRGAVEQTIAYPDSIVPGQSRRRIYMRRYDDGVLQTQMLLRVVVEETADDLVIVTLYKTSKFKKYEEGTHP
jgi:hypothetical protein